MNRFDHVAVVVSDMSASKAFYNKAFGFETVVDRRFDSAGLTCAFLGIPGDGAQLQLNVFDKAQPTHPDFGHFSVRTDGIDELRASHEALGFAPTPMVDAPHQKCYFVKDPDGYPIEVIQPK